MAIKTTALKVQSRTSGNEIILKTVREKPGITTTVIIPAFNEEEGLPIVLEKIFRCTNGVHEIIVVDDGSTDGTADEACRFPCKVIKHKQNSGKGKALETGIQHAKGENLIFIDSDDTYPPEAIPAMTKHLESYDIVYGSRTYGRENIPLFNRFGNFVLQGMIRHIYHFKASDFSTGLYGMKKTHFTQMKISNMGLCVESEIAIKASRMKLRVKDIPIQYSARLGESKLSRFSAGWGNLKNIFEHILWKPNLDQAMKTEEPSNQEKSLSWTSSSLHGQNIKSETLADMEVLTTKP